MYGDFRLGETRTQHLQAGCMEGAGLVHVLQQPARGADDDVGAVDPLRFLLQIL